MEKLENRGGVACGAAESGSGSRARAGALLAFVTCAAACSSNSGNEPPNGPDDPPAPARGEALALGLGSVDPAHYGGWSGPLAGCEPDARTMKGIAEGAGLTARMLLTRDATRARLFDEIEGAAGRLGAGDLFVLSYSGHGGQVPDENGDDPNDGLDETWCLFDGQVLDDELYGALSAFEAGVRVLLVSDSCHSGTVAKADFEASDAARRETLRSEWTGRSAPRAIARPIDSSSTPAPTVRALPPLVELDTLERNREFYRRIGAEAPRDARASMKCETLLFAGCEDAQLSWDLGTSGLFTSELARVWNGGAYSGGGHPAFQVAVRDAVLAREPSQRPAYFKVGVPIPGYEAQKPYSLLAP